MKMFIANACLAGFVAMPLLLLLVRVRKKKYMPWWLMGLILAVAGWLLINIRVEFYYSALLDEVHGYEIRGLVAPQALADAAIADGGQHVFALFFGWLVGPLWSIPFLGAYSLIIAWCGKSKRSTAPKYSDIDPTG